MLDELMPSAAASHSALDIAGQRGHDRCYRAACVLIHKFALSIEQALPLLKEWSDCSCEPPWSEAELTHKLRDALRRRSG